MVMLKLGPDIIDIEGKVKGEYYRRDVCGQHLQAYQSKKRYKPSSQQKAFTKAANAWSAHEWSSWELNAWIVWDIRHPKKNKKGKVGLWGAFLCFMSTAIKQIQLDVDISYYPPDD